jgi:TolB protein
MKSFAVEGVLMLMSLISGPDKSDLFHTVQSRVGLFENSEDIGEPKLAGSSTYDFENQNYTVTGSGYNMWFAHDEFHFVWTRLEGDFILRANATFRGAGVDPHRKLGLIIRSDLESGSAYVDAAVHGDGYTAMQFRRQTGLETEEIPIDVIAPDVIQLERKNGLFIMSVAVFGDTLSRIELGGVELGNEVYAGLFVSSHNDQVRETADFTNVRIIIPAPDDLVQYQSYIGSNLEVMNIYTGHRMILHTYSGSLQAPNWTLNGESLIYNQEGLLYSFDIESGLPTLIDTDFATENNNDHVLSPDGRYLGISHHSRDHGGQSMIYVVPIQGGIPRLVTERGPSYLHGWSPDGKFLTYTGGRNGRYNIYAIPSDGGEEIQLTDTPELDDGSEYSPDGKYIYFNSARTGSMELWRMEPDGNNPEQLTDDTLNNWFPHVSPDGKWIVFLSYLKDVGAQNHPFYKQVYLRLMPSDGGEPKVIAYLYGGQGSINVPSWSPDSKQIAFVSNTEIR